MGARRRDREDRPARRVSLNRGPAAAGPSRPVHDRRPAEYFQQRRRAGDPVSGSREGNWLFAGGGQRRRTRRDDVHADRNRQTQRPGSDSSKRPLSLLRAAKAKRSLQLPGSGLSFRVWARLKAAAGGRGREYAGHRDTMWWAHRAFRSPARPRGGVGGGGTPCSRPGIRSRGRRRGEAGRCATTLCRRRRPDRRSGRPRDGVCRRGTHLGAVRMFDGRAVVAVGLAVAEMRYVAVAEVKRA